MPKKAKKKKAKCLTCDRLAVRRGLCANCSQIAWQYLKKKAKCLTCDRLAVRRGLCANCSQIAWQYLKKVKDEDERKAVEQKLIEKKLILPPKIAQGPSPWRTKAARVLGKL